jgi:hypothetical protein
MRFRGLEGLHDTYGEGQAERRMRAEHSEYKILVGARITA